ncbi:hypothetical protein [Kaistia terrae]|uniref:Uncharacterized protein n=1 Tax=Kaistia terrae TaxID=537017 RepID=A0ABW0PY17_9HYPH
MHRRAFPKAGVAGAAASAVPLCASRALAETAADAAPADLWSLAGKTIAISIVGTDHFFDLKAYQAQIAEVERLGGKVISLDAGRNDQKLVSQARRIPPLRLARRRPCVDVGLDRRRFQPLRTG